MKENKINKKYYIWIWVAIFIASIIRHAYQLYAGYIDEELTTRDILMASFVNVLLYGLIPSWLCFCSASIFWTMSFKRGYHSVPRNDFIYTVMLFTAAARTVMGVIELFAILDSVVYVYTSVILDVSVLSTALYVMYFTVLAPKMNAKEKSEVFSLYSMTYLLVQGLHTAVPCFVYFLLSGSSAITEEYAELLELYTVDMTVDSNTLTACIIGISVLVVFAAVTVVLSSILAKRAKDYIPPKSDDHSDDIDINPFSDDASGGDDKVFEEFDL